MSVRRDLSSDPDATRPIPDRRGKDHVVDV